MARTHKKVRSLPKGKPKHTVASAARGVEEVLRILEGRWKLVILFHLFGGNVLRFSELRRAIPGVSEKMLIQQLRRMERDESSYLNPPPLSSQEVAQIYGPNPEADARKMEFATAALRSMRKRRARR